MMEDHGWTAEEVREQLAREGGLAGLSGVAGGNVRDIQQAAAAGNRSAANAIEVLAYQVRKTIGAYAAAMGGVDAVAFTGGRRENWPAMGANRYCGFGVLGTCLGLLA